MFYLNCFLLMLINITKSFLKKFKSNIQFNWMKSKYKFKNGSEIYSNLIDPSVIIGKKVRIDKYVEIKKGVKIGGYTVINKNAYIESGEIGSYCSIASNTSIGLGEHPMNFISTSPASFYSLYGIIKKDKDIVQQKNPTIIGNDCWIARGAMVLRGVHIGHGAVVAANAVVTKNVPPYAIVCGNPAKIIKYRFDEEVINELLKFNWWEDENKCLMIFNEDFEKKNNEEKLFILRTES
ncbi:CatB-related O-acetyltransferase [Fictibacillus barbaricus]|uniref:Acetyltransferase-like isoleucine patch superfamily enzyme n=1 Tax=Fictibacillus barbaricus TaxID=182136 RepID=A0ABU1U1M5_9BACL|nr:DapH/DapD/GlmU-related protein [Fictibacillus barbaricus]MDR7073318.1 acetyltransferase-like isoleucine patch superfamily enzyme [Fictibacillus barbaricus]